MQAELVQAAWSQLAILHPVKARETGCPIYPALCAVAPAVPTFAMAGDAERLKRALAKELGWDLGTLDGIVEALQAAHNQSEVDEIVQDYLGGSTAVKEVVQVFLGTRRPAQPPQGAQAVGAPAQAMFNYRHVYHLQLC